MKNKTKILSLVIVSLVIGGGVLFAFQNNDKFDNDRAVASSVRTPREQRIDMYNKEGYEVVSYGAAMVDNYENIEELTIDSQIVVKGIIESNEYVMYDGVIFTISELLIHETISTDGQSFNNGDKIKVLQTGGIYEQVDVGADEKEFTTEEDKAAFKEHEGKKFEFTLEEVPVLKEDTETILFLQQYIGPLGEGLYVSIGDYQGRFIVESDNYIEPQSEEISSLEGNKDFTMEEVVAEVTAAE